MICFSCSAGTASDSWARSYNFRIYSADIGDDDLVKYLDSENDWITMNDTNDLSFAIQVDSEIMNLQKLYF